MTSSFFSFARLPLRGRGANTDDLPLGLELYDPELSMELPECPEPSKPPEERPLEDRTPELELLEDGPILDALIKELESVEGVKLR